MSIGLLFSPQGSQQVGMGAELAAANPAAAAVFAEADAALGWSVSQLAWQGPDERLTDTRWAQPALLTASIAAAEALRHALREADLSLDPALLAGHSVGEYAALVAAGAISLADGLALVSRRGELMAEAAPAGGMTAVIGLDRQSVATTIAGLGRPDVVVANDNAPGQVVISGATDALAEAESALLAAGARRTIRLRVSGPFHSPSMIPVGAALSAALDTVDWHDAQPPVVSNVSGTPVSDAAAWPGLLVRQVAAPVEWVRVVETMVDAGVDLFIECGSGAALAGMVRRIAPSVSTLVVTDPNGLAEAVDALAARRVAA